MEAGSRAWWKMEHDGTVFGNLSNHLIASGRWTELEALLSDIRCLLRQHEIGSFRFGLSATFC